MNLYSAVSSTNVHQKSKNFAGTCNTRAKKSRACAIDCARARSHARAQLLLVGMTLDGERDEAIDQRGIGETACGHIFEYMLIVVKPGMVLTSLR